MVKIVTVVKEHRLTYEVEGGPSEPLSDERAIDIAKARMSCNSPLGLVKDEEDTKTFLVAEKE